MCSSIGRKERVKMLIDHNAGEASLRRALRYADILKDCSEEDFEGVLGTIRKELRIASSIYVVDEAHVCKCGESCST